MDSSSARRCAAGLLLALLPACTSTSVSEVDPASPAASQPPPASRPNVPFPTLGGRQVWADVAWHQGWRVQENVLTGHFRLLDPRDVRRAWGPEEACLARLAEAVDGRETAPSSTHLVVLLHGLFRSRHAWEGMEAALREAGFDVAAVGYPSTRRSIEEHAAQVERLLDGIRGYERVSFVTHSLGGLVARALLARDGAWARRLEPGRLVMLGPPSRGAALAGALQGVAPFRWIAGPVAAELSPEGARALAVPAIPFCVVAGARGDGRGWNPLLDGDDDGVVGVEEARLDGAAEMVLVEGLHSFLPSNEQAIAAAVRFLTEGGER